MVQAGETGCAWSVEWAEELQIYAEEVAHLRRRLTQAPLFSCLLPWRSSRSSRPPDPTLTPPHACQPRSLPTRLSALDTESQSDLEVYSNEMNPTLGKEGLIMGGTDYGNESPSRRLFGAAAGNSEGEIAGKPQGSLSGHPVSETVICGDLCPPTSLLSSRPA